MGGIIIISLALCGLSMILALIATWRRFLRHRTAFSFILMLVCSFSSLIELPSLLMKQPSEANNTFDFIFTIAFYGVLIFYNVVILLIALFFKRGKLTRFFLIMLGLFLAILFVVAIIGSITTGKSLDECFFGTCCGVLEISGLFWGFTYKEMCVIVNIYLEAGICLLSALGVTYVTLKRFFHHKTLGNGVLITIGIGYGLAYLAGFLWVCLHYTMPMNDAFDLCYRELVQLAKDYHTTYNFVNYVIFILLFLMIIIGNILIAKLLREKDTLIVNQKSDSEQQGTDHIEY